MRDPRCFPWNENEQPKVVYRSLYQKGAEQNVLEVYHHAKEVWYHEYQFRAGSGLSGEKEVITCQTKAKICLGDVDKTLESFSARALSAGYEFCYTYSCNIQKTDAFGLDYSLSPTDTLPNVVKQKASSRPRPKKKRKKHKKIDTDIDLVRGYFHLPMSLATQKLQIGSTALKKICRKYGIKRWPYRRIRACQKLIEQLEETGAAEACHFGEAEGLAIREKLRDLYAEKEQLCLHGS